LQHDAAKLHLFLSHRAQLIDYAAPMVGCRARAEDIVQEAFIRFSAGEARLAQPVGYLYRIVRNLAVDWARHVAVEGGPPDTGALEALPAPAASPEHAALFRDELRIVAEALGELPERTRMAFEMHRLGGLTLQVIARRLGISVGLAHQLVRDALTHCAERLGQDNRQGDRRSAT
jgi:RNA polymerase sigma-70 factor (ECF subfamily)